MKVDRFDADVRVEGVLVEENRTSSVVGHVEPNCKNVMIDILRCVMTCHLPAISSCRC